MSQPLSVDEQLAKVEQKIEGVEQEIKEVEKEIKQAEKKANDYHEKGDEKGAMIYRKEKEQLRKEKEQLRKKEEQLRKKEEQLREEKKLLMQKSAPSFSSVSKKRKSLPPPVSGNEWTKKTLEQLEINIMPASMEEVLKMGQVPGQADWQLPRLSPIALSLIEACDFIDPHLALLLLPYHEAESEANRLAVPSGGPGWTLFKYLRLLDGVDSIQLESTVDDFVIHLLAALGFNEGPLIILSKNRLSFTMNGDSRVCANADVTVYHISNRFRLAVFEDKRFPGSKTDLENYEAQLVAEAIAAIQANMDREEVEASKSKRSKSEADAAAAVSSSTASSPLDDSGRIFMIRVVGSSFSFYSTRFTRSVIDIVKDYSKVENEIPSTIVYKLTIDTPHTQTIAAVKGAGTGVASSVAFSSSFSSSTSSAKKDELQFRVKKDREFIIRYLDCMRQIILQ